MDTIQIRNTVLPQAADQTEVKINFNITFSSGVTISDGQIQIDLETYENTLPKNQTQLVKQMVLDAFGGLEQ